jgi:hypothetical protein
MRRKSILALNVLALSAFAVVTPPSARAFDPRGGENAQASAQTARAAAEQIRLSVMTARLEAQRSALDAEQTELARITNGGLLAPADQAARANAFRAKAGRLQAATLVLNADMAMTQRALSRANSSAANATEVTGYGLTWASIEKGVYFAQSGGVWEYFDSERPIGEVNLRETFRTGQYIGMTDTTTGLRHVIHLGESNVRIQQAPNGADFRLVPITGVGTEVDGRNVMQVSYLGGMFQQQSPGAWIERQRGRTIARFAVLKRTRDMVQLADDSRKMYIFLSMDSGQILFGNFDRPGQTQNLAPIKSMAAWFQKNGPVVD